MLVSTVCANRMTSPVYNESKSVSKWSAGNFHEQYRVDEPAIESQGNTFTSSLKKCDSNVDMDSVYEWKTFCQNQIMANNLDYLA